MLIHSDWHIHSEASYDATLTLEVIDATAAAFGFKKIGITDHVNYNDEKFLQDLRNSSENVKAFQKNHSNVILGAELTPIAKPEFDYIQTHGTRDGYVAPLISAPFDIELALSKEELKMLGVRYAIGAAHWRVDVPKESVDASDIDAAIREWYRQQLWLACDERVTILGHPWYNGKALWYEDFTLIPHTMHMDIAAALKENNKYVECNAAFFYTDKATEKFRYQYAEFLRELFEIGIPVTYGSDSHNIYIPRHTDAEKYLRAAGFIDGDIVEVSDAALWS